jgi:hypothetical protein
MDTKLLQKQSLRPSKSPMTSISSSQPCTSQGDIEFGLGQKRSKGKYIASYIYMSMLSGDAVATFNPLLTPSPLLDPKVLEQRRKALIKT